MKTFLTKPLTLLITGALGLFVALAAWAFVSPVGSSPDDNFHQANIWCGWGTRAGLCEPVGASSAQVPEELLNTCFVEVTTPASCQGANFGVDMVPNHVIEALNVNVRDYPPLFYATMSLMASNQLVPSVIAMRLVNSALFVGVLVALTVLLGPRWRKPLLLTSLGTLVPLGLFIIPSTNPSSWAFLAGITTWIAVAGFLSAEGRARIGLGIVASLCAVMGAGSRADSAMYVGLSIVIGVFLAWPGWRSRRLILPAALFLIAVAFFFTSSSAMHGVNGFSDGNRNLSIGERIHLLVNNAVEIPSLWTGAFGGWGLGWLDVGMTAVTWVGSSAVFYALVFHGLGEASWKKIIAAGAAGLAAFVLPLQVLMATGVEVGTAVQPRYIFPLLAIVLSVSLLSVGSRVVTFGRVQMWLIVGVLTLANALAMYINVVRYQRGGGDTGWWWTGLPVGSLVVVALGTLAFAIFAIAVTRYSRLLPASDELRVSR